MRKTCSAFVIVMFIFSAQIAHAEERHLWDSVQLMASVNVSGEVVEDISIVGSAAILWNMTNMNVVGLLYQGGGFQISDWYVVNVMATMAVNFPSQDMWSAGISIWQSFNFFNGLLTAFVETDMFFHSEGFTFFGLYTFNIHPFNFMNFGFRMEQVDNSLALGPCLSFSEGVFNILLQHFSTVTADSNSTALRISLGFNF